MAWRCPHTGMWLHLNTSAGTTGRGTPVSLCHCTNRNDPIRQTPASESKMKHDNALDQQCVIFTVVVGDVKWKYIKIIFIFIYNDLWNKVHDYPMEQLSNLQYVNNRLFTNDILVMFNLCSLKFGNKILRDFRFWLLMITGSKKVHINFVSCTIQWIVLLKQLSPELVDAPHNRFSNMNRLWSVTSVLRCQQLIEKTQAEGSNVMPDNNKCTVFMN